MKEGGGEGEDDFENNKDDDRHFYKNSGERRLLKSKQTLIPVQLNATRGRASHSACR